MLDIRGLEMGSQRQDQTHGGLEDAVHNVFGRRLVHFDRILVHETQHLLDVVLVVGLGLGIQVDVCEHVSSFKWETHYLTSSETG